ncbi:MAG: hypothetical protein GXO96_01950 [Nitrospirae bacterium]|nr:hypothetical protein [Candidatus Manganitrophaceae bacterium]
MQSLQKNNTFILFLFLFLTLVIPKNSHGNDTDKRFLITPFENLSNIKSMTSYDVPEREKKEQSSERYTIDRFSELPRNLIEDEIVNLGASVVERQQLEQLMSESDFIRLSGLINPEQIKEIGKTSGATHILLGTITSIQTVKSKVKIRDTTIKTTRLTCAIRVRVIEIETGEIKFSGRAKGSVKYRASEFGDTVNDDAAYSAIEAAILDLVEGNRFQGFFSN